MSETWAQVLTIIISNLSVILVFFGITISLHNSMRDDLRDMREEMKDFHGRMCSLEERKKNG